MKALIGSAVNFFIGETRGLGEDDGPVEVVGLGEVILTVVEPNYEFSAGGKMQRKDTAETFRYTSSAAGLEDLGTKLIGYAGMLRAFEKRVHIEPEDPDGDKS